MTMRRRPSSGSPKKETRNYGTIVSSTVPRRRPLRLLLIITLAAFGLHILTNALCSSFKALDLDHGRWAWAIPSWACLSLSRDHSHDAPSVRLRQGTIVGKVLSNSYPVSVEAFLGIPYALPPTGDRRFRLPEPVKRGNGKIDATSYGYRCPSRPLGSLFPDWDEDCLTVNVFRPTKRAKAASLPVAIYIHGGGYNDGAGKYHDSASMMGWSEKPYIAVNFNYRVGALGFLPSSVTAKEGILNLGLHDQILLLRWIQENIAPFGGDPDNVTLFGFSAGAHSVGHHLMNYEHISLSSKPLFHRAMLESGAATSRAVYPYNATLHKVQFDNFVKEAGCSNLAEEDIMSCLRGKPVMTIAQASVDIFNKYEDSDCWPFQPVIDGKTIKIAPIKAWETGNWAKIPILTGFNTNDGAVFVDPKMDKSSEFLDFFHALIPALTKSDLKKLDKLYPDPLKHPNSPYKETRPIKVGSQYKRADAAYGQFAYICPVRQTAHLASAGQSQPVYLYHWALNKTVSRGASHGDQVEYEVHSPKVHGISETQDKIAGYRHAYLTSFITTGDPNAIRGEYADRPFWKPFEPAESDASPSSEKIMVFGKGNDERAGGNGVGVPAQVVDDVWSAEECKFWSKRTILWES